MPLKRLVTLINGPVTAAKTIWEIVSGIGALTALWTLLGWAGINFEPLAKYGWGAILFASGLLSALSLLSIASLLAAVRYFRGPSQPSSETDRQRIARIQLKNEQTEIIESARKFVSSLTSEGSTDREFRDELESAELFYKLRPHLSPEFMDALNNSRTFVLPPRGSKLTGIAKRFLDEVDRLESLWLKG